MDRSETATCDVCGRQAEVVGVYAIRYIPLSLGHCEACLGQGAYPESWVKWALGKVPGGGERRWFFAEVAWVPDADDYRRLTSEELDAYEGEGRRRWAALDAEVAEARRSACGG